MIRDARGDTIRVDGLTARSEKGRAEVTGYVRLDRLTKPVLDLNIAATEFKALDLKGYLTVTASGRGAAMTRGRKASYPAP